MVLMSTSPKTFPAAIPQWNFPAIDYMKKITPAIFQQIIARTSHKNGA